MLDNWLKPIHLLLQMLLPVEEHTILFLLGALVNAVLLPGPFNPKRTASIIELPLTNLRAFEGDEI
jgi:hypothetical protein